MRWVEGPWRAPCQLKKPFKSSRRRRGSWSWEERRSIVFPNKGSLICHPGKSMIFYKKKTEKKFLLVARPWNNSPCWTLSTLSLDSGVKHADVIWLVFAQSPLTVDLGRVVHLGIDVTGARLQPGITSGHRWGTPLTVPMTQLADAPQVGFVVGAAAGAGAAAPHLGPIEEHLEKYPKHI